MTRLGSRLGSIVVMLALSSSAWAAVSVTVSGSTGPESKVGREGAWRPAVAGAAIGEKDFLAIPAGASVQVTLPDGKVAGFDGKIVVPGRRLVADKTSATNVAWLARAIQNASEAVGGVAVGQQAPGAAKVENVGSRSFAGTRGDGVDSFDGAPGGGSGAKDSRGEADRKKKEAKMESQPSRPSAVANAPPPPPPPPPSPASPRETAAFGMSMDTAELDSGKSVTSPSRADLLRDGLAAESDGNFDTARTALEKAAAAGNGKKEGDVSALRAEAFVALGRIHLQLGDASAAKKALAAAVTLDTAKGEAGPHAARAHYLLGITALEGGDRKAAEAHFAKLKGHPALEAAAKQATSELPR